MDEDSRCAECGSTHISLEDGRYVCHNGHRQEGIFATVDDGDDFGRHGRVIRKKIVREKRKTSKVLHGAKAYQLFLQCWQLILWKQCHTLVYQKGFPAELWTIVRDLWTLWLTQINHRLDDPAASSELLGSDSEGEQRAASDPDHDTDASLSGQPQSRPHQEVSSAGHPLLIDTVVLNYMGLVLLRRCVGLATVMKWIQTEDIPLVRAIRHVPPEMKDRLPGEYHQALDTNQITEPDYLQNAVYRRMKTYNCWFGMAVPPVNHTLLLFGYVRSLALPIEIYALVRRLNLVTEYPFAYPNMAGSDCARRQSMSYPEAQLMALLVIATKLLHPFDGDRVKRYPEHANDLASLRMNWSDWIDARTNFPRERKTRNGSPSLGSGSEIHVTDDDVLHMSDEQLDQYMDWYQRTWIGDARPNAQSQTATIDREILDMFPVPSLPDRRKTRVQHEQAEEQLRDLLDTRVKLVQSTMSSRRVITREEGIEQGVDVPRPGARYQWYRTVDDVATGDTVAQRFHAVAAETACLSLKALVAAVNRAEAKIERWLRERRRDAYFRDETHDDGGDESPADRPASAARDREVAERAPGAREDDGDMDLMAVMEALPAL